MLQVKNRKQRPGIGAQCSVARVSNARLFGPHFDEHDKQPRALVDLLIGTQQQRVAHDELVFHAHLIEPEWVSEQQAEPHSEKNH